LIETSNKVTVSIVSHDQRILLENLLKDLVTFDEIKKLIITVNIPEKKYKVPILLKDKIQFIYNDTKKGFGSNHNYAFKYCQTEFFCILNPDVKIRKNPFSEMICKARQMKLTLIAPIVTDTEGTIEDSFREFLTPIKLFKRFIKSEDYYPRVEDDVIYPDWIAGMIMLFQGDIFRDLGGFDEKYFMYCEDMDICQRAKSKGYRLGVLKSQEIIHFARRDSQKKLKYLLWHITSLVRFWL
jgi:N-acetylglucosaminyl-diphospho-decaprenol L-rhamnosyltransferase